MTYCTRKDLFEGRQGILRSLATFPLVNEFQLLVVFFSFSFSRLGASLILVLLLAFRECRWQLVNFTLALSYRTKPNAQKLSAYNSKVSSKQEFFSYAYQRHSICRCKPTYSARARAQSTTRLVPDGIWNSKTEWSGHTGKYIKGSAVSRRPPMRELLKTRWDKENLKTLVLACHSLFHLHGLWRRHMFRIV